MGVIFQDLPTLSPLGSQQLNWTKAPNHALKPAEALETANLKYRLMSDTLGQ